MRYMSIVKATRASESGQPPDPRVMTAIMESAKELMSTGVMVYTGGLAPSAAGVRLRAEHGQLVQIDGPFAESTELVGGFAIMEVRSRDEAVAVGRRFLQMHVDILGADYRGELEIRQLFSHDDLPPGPL